MEELLELIENKIESEENLIMVKYPYNKLFDIKAEGEISKAKVINEYSNIGEEGPIGVAETGRHLAISGSIHLAKEYDFNCPAYFLAIHAKLVRTEHQIEHSEFLSLKIQTIYKRKRNAKVQGEIYSDSNKLIFSAEIEYHIIQQNVFRKLFNKHLNTSALKNEVSPYIKRKSFQNITLTNTVAQGFYGAVLPEECEGHFEDFPALPVAIVGGLFIDLGIKLFHHATRFAFNKVIITHTEIEALRLAFSGEEVSFSTSIKSTISENELIISGEARVKDEIIAKTEFTIEGFN